jgi:hypothetical protein
VLEPSQNVTVPIKIPPIEAVDYSVISNPAGSKALWVYGWVDYRDEADNTGTSTFCWYLRPKPNWHNCERTE